jgi:hypothetical protein
VDQTDGESASVLASPPLHNTLANLGVVIPCPGCQLAYLKPILLASIGSSLVVTEEIDFQLTDNSN